MDKFGILVVVGRKIGKNKRLSIKSSIGVVKKSKKEIHKVIKLHNVDNHVDNVDNLDS
ncbi:MAG: hypothetical protein K2N51_17830 [Lachnospiraceae bacterium]|nr:hypothetical protein [Lachnospiraceae bacterium]